MIENIKVKPPRFDELDEKQIKKNAKIQYGDYLLHKRSLKRKLHKTGDLGIIRKTYRKFLSKPSVDSFLVFLGSYFKLDVSQPDEIKNILHRNTYLFHRKSSFKFLLVDAALAFLYLDQTSRSDKFLSDLCLKILWMNVDCSSPETLIKSHRQLTRSGLSLHGQCWLFQWAQDSLDYFTPSASKPNLINDEDTYVWIAECFRFLKTVKHQPETIFSHCLIEFFEHPKKKKSDRSLTLFTTGEAQVRLKKNYSFPDSTSGVKPLSLQKFLFLGVLAEYDFHNRRFKSPQQPVKVSCDEIIKASKIFPDLRLSSMKRMRELKAKINSETFRILHRGKRSSKTLWNERETHSEIIKSDGKSFWINVLVPFQPTGLWDQTPISE